MTYALLETAENVRDYLATTPVGERLGDPSMLTVREVTAGNMNRVFIATGERGSVAVKQAPPWVHVAGPSWPIDPARIEAEARAYSRLEALAPESVPTILHVDPARYSIVMEDLSDLSVLRDVLVAQVQAHVSGRAIGPLDLLSAAVTTGRFVGVLTRATSAATIGTDGHADLVTESANAELCALTLDVVLDEPFRPHEHNSWRSALSSRVEELYADPEVAKAVGDLGTRFTHAEEALLHGDLHSGSVMVGTRDARTVTKVFDPEFSFVGPVGLDLGLLWANFAIAAAAARSVGAEELAAEREAAIGESWRAFVAERTDASPTELDGYRRDAWRFAAAEAFRRVAGYSHAADLETLPADAADAASIAVFDRARRWLLTADDPTVPRP